MWRWPAAGGGGRRRLVAGGGWSGRAGGLVAGGGWWPAAVGGRRRLVAGGGWWPAAVGGRGHLPGAPEAAHRRRRPDIAPTGAPGSRRPPPAAPSRWSAPRRSAPAAPRGGVHDDGVAVVVAALEQGQGQRVADLALDEPLERPGPEDRVVAPPGQPGLGRLGDLQLQAPLGRAAWPGRAAGCRPPPRGRPRSGTGSTRSRRCG